jgi:hypothetical protein
MLRVVHALMETSNCVAMEMTIAECRSRHIEWIISELSPQYYTLVYVTEVISGIKFEF